MTTTSKFLFALLGGFTGLGLAILLGAGVFTLRTNNTIIYQELMATLTPATNTPAPATPTVTPTPESAYSAEKIDQIFAEVDEAIIMYDLEKAEELFAPLYQVELNDETQSRFFGTLALLEEYNGHYTLACGYFENQLESERTAENLNNTAYACFACGDYIKAEAYFSELVDWPGIEGNEYRISARDYLDSIRQVLGTPSGSD